jgi:meso-butanediol dehydrogenase/(S,S)-butanediol dehydrogenase/diacetyl reductase
MAGGVQEALAGQVVAVTGGAQGIGLGIARAFAAAGCALVLVDVDAARLGEAAAALRATGIEVMEEHVDITSLEAVEDLFDRIGDRFGRLDVLVNNAGIIDSAPWPDIDPATWSRVFRVNVEGSVACTREAVRIMKVQPEDPRTGCRGKIIFIGSAAAESATPDNPAYGASKAAMRHLCQDVAATHAADAIATTLVYPRRNADGMWRPGFMPALRAQRAGMTEEAVVAAALGQHPSGRFQTADEVATVVLWIAGRAGMSLNGQLVWTDAHVVRL